MRRIEYEDGTSFGIGEFAVACGIAAVASIAIVAVQERLATRRDRKMAKICEQSFARHAKK